jgi:hypothetical protein
MLNSFTVRTYQQDLQHFFRIYALSQVGLGETNYLYDSKIDQNAGYASEEEALMAGRDRVKGIVLSMLDLINDKWPNGWTSEEGGKFPPMEVPIKVWDTFFHYLLQFRYISLNEPTKEFFITERGMNWRTQLEGEVRINS